MWLSLKDFEEGLAFSKGCRELLEIGVSSEQPSSMPAVREAHRRTIIGVVLYVCASLSRGGVVQAPMCSVLWVPAGTSSCHGLSFLSFSICNYLTCPQVMNRVRGLNAISRSCNIFSGL